MDLWCVRFCNFAFLFELFCFLQIYESPNHFISDILSCSPWVNVSYFQVAIPVVPTIRVLVTFTKFEELQSLEDFSTPPSSPEKNCPSKKLPSSSWFQWMKGSSRQKPSKSSGSSNHVENMQDPFMIPPDYTWISPEVKKKKLQENKRKSKKRPESVRVRAERWLDGLLTRPCKLHEKMIVGSKFLGYLCSMLDEFRKLCEDK